MAESTYTLSRTNLQNQICDIAGLGQAYSSAAAADQARVDNAMKSGLSRFYFSAIDPRTGSNHEWSFLNPATSFATTADDYTYTLSDEFDGIIGDPYFVSSSNGTMQEIRLVSDGVILKHRERSPAATGRPYLAAIQPLVNAAQNTASNRYQMILYPTPDAAYTIGYRHTILPDFLTSSIVFPYGSAAHSHTIYAACLAEFDRLYNDSVGNHEAHYREMLVASIMRDSKSKRVQTLGYCGDPSVGGRRNASRHDPLAMTLSLRGTEF